LFERAWAKLWNDGEALPVDDLVAQLVALGVPTPERAMQIIEAHFLPGGLAPIEERGKPSIAFLIQKHASTLPTPELLALILKHHPGASLDEIESALRAQAAANFAEADALEAERRRRQGDDQ
jgi:hypothetical protein